MLFCRKKVEDSVEERFNTAVELIKDLPRPDYRRLKEAMDLAYDSYQKIRNVKTEEEKAIEKEAKQGADIEVIEKVMEGDKK